MAANGGLMLGSSAAMGGLSSIGTAFSQSQAMQAQGAYQNTVAQANAGVAGIQSTNAIQQGDIAATQSDLKTRGIIGSQRASLAAQGVDINSGSAAAVQASTGAVGALDSLTIRNNAWRQAWGYQVQAENDTASGQFAQMAANNNSTNTLLTGGMNAVSSGIKSAYYYGGGSPNPHFNL